jgi:uncharacterized cupin superfamily protein
VQALRARHGPAPDAGLETSRSGAEDVVARHAPGSQNPSEGDVSKIDKAAAPRAAGSRYPSPFDEPCRRRTWLKLGDAAGLTQFGVNVMQLAPGVWSSQRHWHSHEDEFVYVLSGEVVLVTDAGEQLLQAGDCAGFRAGSRDGHCLQNRSPSDAEILVVGTRCDEDHGEYPDIDLIFTAGRYAGTGAYLHKDGSPYPPKART